MRSQKVVFRAASIALIYILVKNLYLSLKILAFYALICRKRIGQIGLREISKIVLRAAPSALIHILVRANFVKIYILV